MGGPPPVLGAPSVRAAGALGLRQGEDGLWVPLQPSDGGPSREKTVLLAPQRRLEREGGTIRLASQLLLGALTATPMELGRMGDRTI